MKRGIIFDLDGTMWDACETMADSYEAYVREFFPEYYAKGFSVTGEKARSVCGKPMEELGNIIFELIPAHIRKDILDDIWAYEVDYIREHGKVLIYPGLKEMLIRLKKLGYGLYIVSNCQKGYIEAFLYWSGTQELFDDFESNGNTGLMKADNIKLLAARNGLEKAVYVGDTQGDMDSADEAGVSFIHAAYGFGTVNREGPTARSAGEIADIVEGEGEQE